MTLLSCQQEDKVNFEIKGSVKNLNGVKVVLEQDGDVLDSTIIENGYFSVKGNVLKNQLCSIVFSDSQPYMHQGTLISGWLHDVDVFVEENSSYLFKANDKDDILYNRYSIISNSKTQKEFEKFNNLVKNDVLEKKNELTQIEQKRELALKRKDEKAYNDYTEDIRIKEQGLNAGKNEIVHDFVIKNPNSYVSIYLLSKVTDVKKNLDFYRYIYEKLDPAHLEHPYARLFKKKLKAAEKMKSGNLNFKFTAEDETGRFFNLANFEGKKLIVLDFWATWCVPCVKEIPASLKFEKEFADLNVAYVFISYDLDKKYWAAQSNQLGLTNSFILDEANKEILKDALDITSIPRYVIMNPKGDVLVSDAPWPSRPALKELVKGLL